ncbi:MAG: hypothetical protein ACLTKT_01030 [Clostridia bacterium]|jgi:hypothetical protein|nr:hypothetical protein [Clostridium sp.]
MEDSNIFKYCVAMKKGRKIFNMIVGGLMILLSSIFIILTIIVSILEQEIDFYTFLGILMIPLLFFCFGITGVITATKRVEIYKGKVVYHIGVINREYPMSDIRTSKTQTETYNTGLYYEDMVPTTGYDKVITFYDKTGKKIFKFGLSYYNVERLQTDVKNTQKSISKRGIKK